MADDRKKKIAIVSVCSLILVAMVVALTIGSSSKEDDTKEVRDITASQKAIKTICQSTDYKEACVDSLKSSGNNTTDPKELIELAFEASIKYINEAVHNSSAIKAAQSDPRAKSALESCQELADRAVSDLKRTYEKFNEFDVLNVKEMIADMKIWLSGAITYQETCLDGFEEVPGDAGEKMREALTTAMQMTSNGLAMVTEISKYLDSIGVQSFNSRRLLSEDLPVLGHGEEFPDWIDSNGRKLLSAPFRKVKPDIVVAKDGSGKYHTINEALKHVPKLSEKLFVIHIKKGVYQEKVHINSSMTNLMLVGDGPTKTRITGNLNFIDGTGTYHTATVAVQGDNFIARDIGFENSAGPEKHQAVALRVSADKAIFYNCHMDGYQDTLYVHTYRQYYRDCLISGTIDFIFGDSAALFQNCVLLVRKPLDNQRCIVTAQGRKDIRQPTGLVLQNCTFKADPEYYPLRNKLKSYLGRPWKEYSRTIIMESYIDDLIQPEGWLPWNEAFALDTLFYTEFNNRGPASSKGERVKWAGLKELPAKRVERFTAAEFLDGNKWIKHTKVPYESGFIFPLPKEDPNVKYSPVVPEEDKDLGKSYDKSSYSPIREPSSPAKEKDKDNDDKSESKSDGDKSDSIPRSEIAAPPTSYSYIATPPVSYSRVASAPAPSPVSQPKDSQFSLNKIFV
ncbi:hypothetical protein ACJIZ3_000909 [Penstemon smallii]|uniref:Pectinesterase n=1 Tax=Penstemon smallii TaxID=265156 RepID=A0ABD3U3L0_9LAMI